MKKQNWKTLLLIAFLICITFQQRGGGGSRGGGSRGGGGGSFSSGRSTGYYGSSYSGGGALDMILDFVIFSIAGITMFLYFCFTCKCCCCCKNQQENEQQPLHETSQQEFQNQKIQNNRINTVNLSDQQFQLKLNQFVDLIKNTNNQTSSFTYSQGLTSNQIKNTNVTIQKQDTFLYRIQMRGTDQLGAWSGKGYFLNTDNGVLVWWMKDYYNKEAAGQTGQWSHLVYKSTQCNYNQWNGIWYFVGFQNDPQYSGTWNLSLRYLPQSSPNYISQNSINNNFNYQPYNGPNGGFNHSNKIPLLYQ